VAVFGLLLIYNYLFYVCFLPVDGLLDFIRGALWSPLEEIVLTLLVDKALVNF
jgi:hypothetical protein